MHAFHRQYDSAVAYFRRVLAIDPQFPVHTELGEVYLWMGAPLADARREIETEAGSRPDNKGTLCQLYARLGDSISVRRFLSEARIPEDVATCYLAVHDRAHALEALEAGPLSHLINLEKPFFDPVTSDRRFIALLSHLRAR